MTEQLRPNAVILLALALTWLALAPSALAADGEFDTSFSGDGKATIPIDLTPGGQDALLESAQQDDGKLVSVGIAADAGNNQEILVVRTLTNGDLDPSFSGDGILTYSLDLGQDNLDFGSGIAIQPNGKILVLASTERSAAGDQDAVVLRINSDGTPDTTFNNPSPYRIIVIDRGGANGYAPGLNGSLLLRPNGKMVITGTVDVGAIDTDFFVTQLNSDGTLDTSFGDSGSREIPFNVSGGAFDSVSGADLLPGGEVVLAGSAGTSTGRLSAAARVTEGGDLDTSFSADGRATVPFFGVSAHENFSDVAATSDGGQVFTGFTTGSPTQEATLVKLDANGSLDAGFSGNGQFVFDFGAAGKSTDAAISVDTQSDDKIVVAGGASDGTAGSGDAAVARFLPGGGSDTLFAGNGKLTFDVDGDNDEPIGVMVGSDDSIFVSGAFTGDVGANRDALIAKLLVDLVPPVATIVSGPADGSTTGSSASFGFSSNESGDFLCELNGPTAKAPSTKAFSVCASPYEASGLPDGTYTFSVKARDEQFNEGAAASRSFTVDTSAAPDTEVTDPDVTAAKKQKQKGKVKVKIKGGAQEAVTGVAKGKITVKGGKKRSAPIVSGKNFKLKKVKKSTGAGKQTVYKLTLKKKRDNKKVLKLLKKGKDLRANPSLKLTDAAGNSVVEKRVVRLK